ncbi:hypothetical protein ACHAXR_001776 [Thalassiosira sp. AJA248-18]
MKKRENERRHNYSTSARAEYHRHIALIKRQLSEEGGTISISNEERQKIFKLRRKMAQPTPEDYASLCQWMDENKIEYVQAPFEADPQMKQLINEGRAAAAITEDGDLVVYEVPRIMSEDEEQTTLNATNSTDQPAAVEQPEQAAVDEDEEHTFNEQLDLRRIGAERAHLDPDWQFEDGHDVDDEIAIYLCHLVRVSCPLFCRGGTSTSQVEILSPRCFGISTTAYLSQMLSLFW